MRGGIEGNLIAAIVLHLDQQMSFIFNMGI
jgi:hypothetical protein